MTKSVYTLDKREDANLKFFHGVMFSRTRTYVIMRVEVNGERIGGVNNVTEGVINHFEIHFKFVTLVRPDMENLSFKTLSLVGASRQISFTEDEVRRDVWNCDSYKTLGLMASILVLLRIFGERSNLMLCGSSHIYG